MRIVLGSSTTFKIPELRPKRIFIGISCTGIDCTLQPIWHLRFGIPGDVCARERIFLHVLTHPAPSTTSDGYFRMIFFIDGHFFSGTTCSEIAKMRETEELAASLMQYSKEQQSTSTTPVTLTSA